jgi:hypothetical protein
MYRLQVSLYEVYLNMVIAKFLVVIYFMFYNLYNISFLVEKLKLLIE